MGLNSRKNGNGPAGPYFAGKKMKRIVVSLLKGGVAKSETAVSLAFGLSARGRRVLLVDTDVQAHCSDMLGLEPERGLADLVAGWGSPDSSLTEARENLWLLAGGNDLAALKMEIARREMASEAVLTEALEIFEGQFDYMIMDTAPGWDTLLVNALYASRNVLSPVSMEPMALSGLVRFEERLQVIQKYKPDLRLRWVVPTFVDGRVRKSTEILNQLRERYGDLVSGPIKYSVKASEAPAYGKTVFEHDPKGNAAEGYNQLTERIMRDCEGGAVAKAKIIKKESPVISPAPPPPEARPEPVGQQIIRQLQEAEKPRPAALASLTGEVRRPASGEPRREPKLTRQELIEKLLKIKESASPRSRAKFTWVIDRLENADRNWTEVDLKQIDQLISKMVRSDRSGTPDGLKAGAAGPGPEANGSTRPASGPLTTRLQWTSPAGDADEELIQTRSIRPQPRNAGTAGG